MLPRLDIDRRQLPPLHRVVEPVLEPPLLDLLVAAQPIFEEQDSIVDQMPFEVRGTVEEFLNLLRRRKAHHPLDAGAIVPAAVEQNDFALGRKMLGVALEIPLRPLALAWAGKGHDAALARI